MWNFFNGSARDYFMQRVVEAHLDLAAQARVDGMFFDASTTFMRAEGDEGTHKLWRGAANAPPPAVATNATVLSLQAEIIAGVAERAARRGVYPAFNSRLLDMSLVDEAKKEQIVLSRVGAQGLFRYYDLGSMLDRALIVNALAEASPGTELFHLYAVRTPHTAQQRAAEVAAFLLVRGMAGYDYFTFHSSYYDAGFVWHEEWDVDYGKPISDAVATWGERRRAVSFERNYTKCTVRVVCPASINPCSGKVQMLN